MKKVMKEFFFFFYEVDTHGKLHELHNDLPFLPDRR